VSGSVTDPDPSRPSHIQVNKILSRFLSGVGDRIAITNLYGKFKLFT
jgi:hypothetical protein